MISPGENYYRLFEGKMPEYVPVFEMVPYPGVTVAAAMASPRLGYKNAAGVRTNAWGVEMVSSAETNYAGIPKTWDFILEDICDWRKVIKNPDLSAIDWKERAREDLEFFKIDRKQSIVLGTTNGGVFQDLMSFMGFSEGLVAMITEPEEVKALFEYLLEYYLELQHKIIEYYSPDAIYLLDDTAAKAGSFISSDVFKELLLPIYKVLIDDAKDHGLPVQFHNCGRCEDTMGMLVEAGVGIWDPVQCTNDIARFKEKYGSRCAVAGCWDWVPPQGEYDEAEIRRQVRETIDKYAPGGAFAMCGGANIVGEAGDTMCGAMGTIRGWVLDEAYKYGADFYKK